MHGGCSHGGSGVLSGDETSGGPAAGPQQIAAAIRAHVVDAFLLGRADSFSDETPLVEAGIVDSTGIMEIVDFVEDTFAIAVRDVDLVSENFDSVTRMARFVHERLRGER